MFNCHYIICLHNWSYCLVWYPLIVVVTRHSRSQDHYQPTATLGKNKVNDDMFSSTLDRWMRGGPRRLFAWSPQMAKIATESYHTIPYHTIPYRNHSHNHTTPFWCLLFNLLCPHIALTFIAVSLSTVTVQTPLDILFVSRPPLCQPKQLVPHEEDWGVEGINATMCVCKCIQVLVCVHVCLQVCMSVRGHVYITE